MSSSRFSSPPISRAAFVVAVALGDDLYARNKRGRGAQSFDDQ
jgi:hypothetical protein